MKPPLRTGPLQSGNCQLEWLHFQAFETALKPNQAISADVPGTLGRQDLMRIVGELVERHEGLRTTFSSDAEGNPTQYVWEAERTAIHEFHDATRGEPSEEFTGFMSESFDIRIDRPVRAAVVDGGQAGRQLVLIMPHIAIDAVGFRALRSDLEMLIGDHASSHRPSSDRSRLQPIDLAGTRAPSRSAKASPSARFWNERISEMPGGIFPVSTIPEHVRRVDGTLQSSELARALEKCANTYGVSANIILAAAVAASVSLISGQPRIPMHLVWASRMGPHAETVVGSFAKNLMLAIDTRSDTRFHGVVLEAHRVLVESARHNDFDLLEFHESVALASRSRGTRIGSGIYVNCLYNIAEPARRSSPTTSVPKTPVGSDVRELEVVRSKVVNRFSIDSCVLGFTARRLGNGDLGLWVNAVDAVFDRDSMTALIEGVEKTILGYAEDQDFSHRKPAEDVRHAMAPSKHMVSLRNEWVDTNLVSETLLMHRHVNSASITVDASGLTAEVGSAVSELEIHELREFLLSRLDNRSAIVVPNRIRILRRSSDAVVRDHGFPDPRLDALCKAAADANMLTSVSPFASYVENGCRLKYVPKVLRALEESEFSGLRPMDFLIPCSLESLASRLQSDPLIKENS